MQITGNIKTFFQSQVVVIGEANHLDKDWQSTRNQILSKYAKKGDIFLHEEQKLPNICGVKQESWNSREVCVKIKALNEYIEYYQVAVIKVLEQGNLSKEEKEKIKTEARHHLNEQIDLVAKRTFFQNQEHFIQTICIHIKALQKDQRLFVCAGTSHITSELTNIFQEHTIKYAIITPNTNS